ncbi:MAG: hypothetical protein LBK44_01740 [Spirochaetales bacterium]|jgi:hypothetical protein|nr:hypothetical protein [Spirochaetales bacterium]
MQKMTKDIKVVFLDIDGVLQPPDRQERFKHIREIADLYQKLTAEFGVDYYQYDKYDVAAVYYDWDKESVSELKRILDTTKAKIVISSDWKKFAGMKRVVDFLRIHGLADYVIGVTPDYDTDPQVEQCLVQQKVFESRAAEILVYLARHPEITRYVALDDINLVPYLGDNAVVTRSKMYKKHADRCIELLGLE